MSNGSARNDKTKRRGGILDSIWKVLPWNDSDSDSDSEDENSNSEDEDKDEDAEEAEDLYYYDLPL